MTKYSIFIIALLGLAACQTDISTLDEKKKQLEIYSDQLSELKVQMDSLKKDIMAMDSTFNNSSNKSVLITAIHPEEKEFIHKIELRGSVESRKNVVISSEIPGKIQRIHVREGQSVKKGMKMIELDAEIIKNRIAELNTTLELANIMFERQENLWKQNIGTEIQYLESKNRKEALERQLTTANSELARAIIRAPFDGSIDEIPAKEGGMAQPGTPLLRIVNPNDVYIKADISERFIGKFRRGDDTEVYFPSQDKSITSKITSVSQVINNENRTFEIEISVPQVDFVLKPNQVTVLKLSDYINTDALTLPTRLIQKDDVGMYVYAIEETDGEMIARKTHINTGISYNNETEVLGGVTVNQKIVDKGYRELSDGVLVTLAPQKEQSLAIKN